MSVTQNIKYFSFFSIIFFLINKLINYTKQQKKITFIKQ